MLIKTLPQRLLVRFSLSTVIVLFSLSNIFGQATINVVPDIDLCVGGGYTTIGDIIVSETNSADFGVNGENNRTFVLNVPSAEFEFDNTSGAIYISAGNGISPDFFIQGTSTFTLQYDATAGAALDEFVITGLRIRAITSSATGSITTSGTSDIVGDVPTINGVDSYDVPSPSITSSNTTVCVGDAGETYSVTASGTDTYDWTVIGGSITSGQGTNEITVTWDVSGSKSVNVEQESVAGGCVGSASQPITVNSTPSVVDPSDQALCTGDNTVAVNFAGTGTSYDWVNDTPGIGLAASGTGDIGSFTVANLGASTIVATITVTPQNLSGGVTCSGPTQSFTITVYPDPQLNAVGNQVFCPGESVSIPLGSNVAGSTIAWTNDNAGIGISTTGNGDIIFTAPSNNTGAAIVGNISVTSSKDGCTSSTPETFTITISPDNVIAQKADISVCPGDN
ncbi:MAG: hypothetical protein RIB54_01330, partial [Fulvivirga sp.]|uniref:hypothetical protein n=1 Tax=Fulvivirga sp. TaxID=1931237 RepID=UPI0032EB955F